MVDVGWRDDVQIKRVNGEPITLRAATQALLDEWFDAVTLSMRLTIQSAFDAL